MKMYALKWPECNWSISIKYQISRGEPVSQSKPNLFRKKTIHNLFTCLKCGYFLSLCLGSHHTHTIPYRHQLQNSLSRWCNFIFFSKHNKQNRCDNKRYTTNFIVQSELSEWQLLNCVGCDNLMARFLSFKARNLFVHIWCNCRLY